MNNYRTRFVPVFLIFILLLVCGGCSKDGSSGGSNTIHQYQPGETDVLKPSADGDVTAGGDPLLLDFSHVNQGYFMGMLNKPHKKINIQVIGPDSIVYKYFLDTPDKYAVFPLTAGNGTYIIMAFENISGDQYASLLSYTTFVELDNEFLPFLYPNQFVDFDSDNAAVSLAAELSKDAPTDIDALSTIFDYVTATITYDYEKPERVNTNYLPDIEDTLHTKTGICFDYAALTVAMLRSLSIPSRLDIGYAGSVYHAWVTVYIESIGWVDRAIEFNGDEWKLLDPTFVSSSDNKTAIMDYIGDGENYTTMFVR